MESVPGEFERAVGAAEVLRAMAHPVRLCIIRGLLRAGECNVQGMQDCLKSPQSTISQHLAKLRAARVIEGRRSGPEVFYRVSSETARRVCEVLFERSDGGQGR